MESYLLFCEFGQNSWGAVFVFAFFALKMSTEVDQIMATVKSAG